MELDSTMFDDTFINFNKTTSTDDENMNYGIDGSAICGNFSNISHFKESPNLLFYFYMSKTSKGIIYVGNFCFNISNKLSYI